MRRFLLRGRLLFRLRPRNSSSDESAASYSLVGCTPALPASALPADVNPEPAGWNCQPPPHECWGIFDRRYGEFSTGVDTGACPEVVTGGLRGATDKARRGPKRVSYLNGTASRVQKGSKRAHPWVADWTQL